MGNPGANSSKNSKNFRGKGDEPSEIHTAARNGDLQKVESICMSNPLAVNSRDKHSRTPSMCTTTGNLLQVIYILAQVVALCKAADHIVGNSIWSIPPNNEFYSNWATNKTFSVGDNLGLCRVLVFKFETGLSDVTQVSRREYESCAAENSFQTILVGPARVPLIEPGMAYFICTFGNYCTLGQKVSIPGSLTDALTV